MTGKPSLLQSIESQRVLHDRATESHKKLHKRPLEYGCTTLRPVNPASILHRQAGHIKNANQILSTNLQSCNGSPLLSAESPHLCPVSLDSTQIGSPGASPIMDIHHWSPPTPIAPVTT